MHMRILVFTLPQLLFVFNKPSQIEKITNMVDRIQAACEENSQ